MNNKIIAWQNDGSTKLVSHISDYKLNKEKYNPEMNARNLARLLMYSLPGNTLDLILDKIESDLIKILKSNPDILLMHYDIQNRIRTILNELADIE